MYEKENSSFLQMHLKDFSTGDYLYLINKCP